MKFVAFSVAISICSASIGATPVERTAAEDKNQVVETFKEHPKLLLAVPVATYVLLNKEAYVQGFVTGLRNLPKAFLVMALVSVIVFPLTELGIISKGLVGTNAAPTLLVETDKLMMKNASLGEELVYRAFLRTFVLEELPFRLVGQRASMAIVKAMFPNSVRASEAGLLVNAIVFGGAHANNIGQAIVATTVSYLFGLTRIYDNFGLGASAGYHAANNLFMAGAEMVVKNLLMPKPVRIDYL